MNNKDVPWFGGNPSEGCEQVLFAWTVLALVASATAHEDCVCVGWCTFLALGNVGSSAHVDSCGIDMLVTELDQ